MAERLLIEAGTVLTMDPGLGVLEPGQILVEDGKIVDVGADLGVTDAERISMPDSIAMPGFVDTHRHTWQAPLRLLASDWTLGHYLMGIHSGFSKHFRPEDTYIGNLLGTSEALDSGITTLLDWSHNLRHAGARRRRDRGPARTPARAPSSPTARGAEQWSNLPSPMPHSDDVQAPARRVLLQRGPAGDAGDGAARPAVRDQGGDARRLRAGQGGRHADHGPRRRRRVGPLAADRVAARRTTCSPTRSPTSTATNSPTTSCR